MSPPHLPTVQLIPLLRTFTGNCLLSAALAIFCAHAPTVRNHTDDSCEPVSAAIQRVSTDNRIRRTFRAFAQHDHRVRATTRGGSPRLPSSETSGRRRGSRRAARTTLRVIRPRLDDDSRKRTHADSPSGTESSRPRTRSGAHVTNRPELVQGDHSRHACAVQRTSAPFDAHESTRSGRSTSSGKDVTAVSPRVEAAQRKTKENPGFTGVRSGRRDSNPRPPPWQGGALPAEPLPHRSLVPAVPHRPCTS